MRLAIVGAGPTSLGLLHRLYERGVLGSDVTVHVPVHVLSERELCDRSAEPLF